MSLPLCVAVGRRKKAVAKVKLDSGSGIIVVNNKQVDVYLNGKLTKSILLPNIPWISNDNLYIGQAGNNFFGHVALVEYVNDALSTNKVEELYDKNKNSSELEKELITYSEYYKEKMSKK